MAFQDNDYVKAPYLQAGDSLKINGTTSGFSIKSGNTGFIYGTNDGTLTMGEEGVPTSIPTLNINAREINWNGRPLDEYFASAGGSSDGLNALSSRVDNLQTQLTTEITELRETDEVFTSEIEDLRLKSLGASVNILQNTLNNYAFDICGIVIPVTLLNNSMPEFNTIVIGGLRSSMNGYVSVYHSQSTTPSTSGNFTLLHKDTNLITASGTDSSEATVTIKLSKYVKIPSSGIIVLAFATSSSAPEADNLSWLFGNSVESKVKLSVYTAGGSNPTATNGVWVLQKRPGASFVTYAPSVTIVCMGHADDAALHVDSELRRKIDDLAASSADYMTEAETKSAISNYRSIEGNLNLGTLVEQLTTSQVWSLVKGDVDLQIDTAGMYLSNYSAAEEHSELSVTATCVTALAVTTGQQSSEFILKPTLTSLSQINGSTAGITQLSLSDGRLNMQLVNTAMRSGFSMEALYSSDSTQQNMVRMMYYGSNQSTYSSLTLSSNEAELRYVSSPGVSAILTLSSLGCTLGIANAAITPWDGLIGTTSQYVPTISIVHYLIQSALAN